MADNQAYVGSMIRGTDTSDASIVEFMIRRVLGRSSTVSLVRVMAVRPGAGLDAVGSVDVQPMVHQVAGDGNAWPYATIPNVPYLRLQGGASAIVMDPQVGDIGLACFCAEDISTVKVTRQASPPGSRRRFSMGDALYLGGVLNGVPSQYIRFDNDGITVQAAPGQPIRFASDTEIVVDTPKLTVTGDIETGAGSTFNGLSFDDHKHSGVTAGSGTSGPPSV